MSNCFSALFYLGKKDYGPLPGYMVDKMIKSFPSESEETKPEKTETKVEVSEAKGQDNLQIRPLPGQTEEGKIKLSFVNVLSEVSLKTFAYHAPKVTSNFCLLTTNVVLYGFQTKLLLSSTSMNST